MPPVWTAIHYGVAPPQDVPVDAAIARRRSGTGLEFRELDDLAPPIDADRTYLVGRTAP